MNEDEKKKRLRKAVFGLIFGISLFVGGIIVTVFIFFPESFASSCENGLRELYELAEKEGEYTLEFENQYEKYFEECKNDYTMADQIEINQKINEIIKNQRQSDDA